MKAIKMMKEEDEWGSWDRYMDEIGGHRKVCGVDMIDLANKYGTPLYVIFESIIEDNYKKYKTLEKKYKNHLLCYAVKANATFALLKLLSGYGVGADVASEYELKFALDAGIPPEKIRANGNCKSDYFLEECVKRGIIINVDPEEELYILNDVAQKLGNEARVNLRLSGFPLENITSPNIFTCGGWTKFGTDIRRARDIFRDVKKLTYINLQGLMVHLGSQIAEVAAYAEALNILIDLVKDADDAGIEIEEIDMGGGFGISYMGNAEWKETKEKIKKAGFTWRDVPLGYEYETEQRKMVWQGEEFYAPLTPDLFIERLFSDPLQSKLKEIGSLLLVLEPGRGIVGNAGLTIFKVCHVGRTPNGQNMIHVDGGANCNSQSIITPEQVHRMDIINDDRREEPFKTFVAGNLCYTGDLLSRIKISLGRKPMRGDFIVFYDTGAYEDFFASNANLFPRPARVMVLKDGGDKLVVRREEYADIFSRDMGLEEMI